MGGSAFWDSAIIWLTLFSILVLGSVVGLTKLALRVAGKSVGWGQAALYVVAGVIGLQVVSMVVSTLYFLVSGTR